MRKENDSQTNTKKNTIIKLDECKFIRQNGTTSVYLMKDNRAVKIFQNPENCKSEYDILKKAENNCYFPMVYNFCGHYIIREYFDCINIVKYISIHGFNETLALKLIVFITELSNLNFPKLYITLNDIFVKKNLELIILNCNESFTSVKLYESIFNDLDKLGLLHKFLKVLKDYDETLFKSWTK